MLNATIVKRLETSSEWLELQKHIQENIDSLNSLDGIDFLDKEKAAIEGRARELAKDKLLEILEPFGSAGDELVVDKHVGKKTGVL